MRARVKYFTFFSYLMFAVPASNNERCDRSQCKGPIKYYEVLACTPVLRRPGDCCGYKYNCSNLQKRTVDKCYANGHEYSIGESLRGRDEICYTACTCRRNIEGIAFFSCFSIDYTWPIPSGCYRPRRATECYPGPVICPKRPEDVPKCHVDGKTYKDGEFFVPQSESKKMCYCGPNYKGFNVEPFCEVPRPSDCRTEIYHTYESYRKCAPIYHTSQSLLTDCSIGFRCYNSGDRVISRRIGPHVRDMICEIENLTMYVGDELAPSRDPKLRCVRCVCEIPPVPTCRRRPIEDCE